jgi:acyl-CoA synthetase (AMP-forming)/AMP-acid ligase II
MRPFAGPSGGDRVAGPAMRSERPSGPRPLFSSIPHLLDHHAERIPDAPALLGPGRRPLTYAGLRHHVDGTGRVLRAMGIGREDRVAAVLPNGPELVAAILSVASCAICAPINGSLGADELDRYFSDLRLRALITQAGFDSAARRVALSHGIEVVEVAAAADAPAGRFTLAEAPGAKAHEPAGPGDVALLMLTSGTTSRPKAVPLTHANVCASAFSSGEALMLGENDRCLNVLPLFHGHGLFATVLTSLAAGGGLVCTPGCDVNRFFGWLTEFRPTWYSAVPTMHQAILSQARQSREQALHRLRFIRSASAPLPPAVSAELERTFEAPVIEFYGMTETASAPIACNPFPPRTRKAGSVGLPVGLQVAITDPQGAPLPNGQTGQVVVRGASVMAGYDGDPAATRAAFAGGWFKTGDHGFFDQDGYLFLIGRKQEIINRGGEKIAPREIDEVLLEHPAIAEAATFGVPHATLGEDVASAVVLRPHAAMSAKDIRQFAAGRLAEFKVPRQVLFVDELPKTPSGKVQRAGLAGKLGLTAEPQTFVAPRTALEKALATRWAEILRLEQVGIHDDFFALGGDSLLAIQVLVHICELTQLQVEISRFFEGPTIADLAGHLETLIAASQKTSSPVGMAHAARDPGAPASMQQERLFRLQELLPDLPFTNVLHTFRVTSRCDAAVLERCIDEMIRRHEILRTTLAFAGDRLVQVVAPHMAAPVFSDDLRALSAAKMTNAVRRIVQAEMVHSFDLAGGPLFRVRLLRLAGQEHLLLITTHRIMIDGWSLGLFLSELVTLYDAFAVGEPSPLAPLSRQYADFATWQRNWQAYPDMHAQLAYWRAQLRDPLPPMRLASARSVRPIDRVRTVRRDWAIPAELMDAASAFSHGQGGTLFMVLLAALKALLQRYLAQDDVRVATNVANRNRPGTETLMGRLANTVVLRTDLAGDPNARQLLRRVRTTTLGAFTHQNFPFEQLTEILARERGLPPGPLAPVMLLLNNASLRPSVSSAQLSFEEANPDIPVPLVTVTTFDIILILRETADGLMGTCIYKPALLGSRAVDRLLRDFRTVLEQMVAQPELPISAISLSGQNIKRRARQAPGRRSRARNLA